MLCCWCMLLYYGVYSLKLEALIIEIKIAQYERGGTVWDLWGWVGLCMHDYHRFRVSKNYISISTSVCSIFLLVVCKSMITRFT
jgi:hypothetical protein